MSDYKEITRKEFVEGTKSGFHTFIGNLTYKEKEIMEKNIKIREIQSVPTEGSISPEEAREAAKTLKELHKLGDIISISDDDLVGIKKKWLIAPNSKELKNRAMKYIKRKESKDEATDE